MRTPEHKRKWLCPFKGADTPLAVYAAIFLSMTILWVIQEVHPDVTLGLFTELGGAAFTLFIINVLLVRSRTKRWRLVQGHVAYLTARQINRLRDGIAVRAFGFHPDIPEEPGANSQDTIRSQRAEYLRELARHEPESLRAHFAHKSLFTQDTYAYLQERAQGVWDLINMKYAEFMEPELVAKLMHLHTHLKDLEGHVRQYARGEWFPEDASHYHFMAEQGASVSALAVVRLLNAFKEMGYSEAASLSDAFGDSVSG